MKNVIILLFVVVLFSWEAMTKTQSFLPSSFQTSFTKKTKALVGKKLIESKGEMDYMYPSQIYLKYDEGKIQKTVVVSKENVWDYTPPFIESEKGELNVYKNHSIGILKFLDLLHDGLKDNKMFTVKHIDNKVNISFSADIIKKFDFTKAEFIKKDNVKMVSTVDDVKEIHIYFKTRKPNHEIYVFDKVNEKSFNDKHFDFSTPKNTNVKNN